MHNVEDAKRHRVDIGLVVGVCTDLCGGGGDRWCRRLMGPSTPLKGDWC